MDICRKFLSLCTVGAMVTTLLLPEHAYAGGDGGNGQAKKGQTLGLVLGIVGVGTIAIGASMLPNTSGYVWMAMGIAEVAGAAIAMSNNSKTEEQTRSGPEMPTLDAAKGGGVDLGSLGLPPGTTIADLCAKAGIGCTCGGVNCTKPTINIPTLDQARAGLEAAYKTDPNAYKGMNLQDALSDLDNNYKEAENVANKFNDASNNGAFNGGGGSRSLLASEESNLDSLKDSKNLTSGKDGVKTAGDNNGKASDGEGAAGTLVAKLPGEIAAAKRDALPAVERHGGLLLSDARTGRLLTIFERVTRAIRGDHDRDIILAKIEWARKDLAKKQKIREGKTNRTFATILK